MTGAVLGALWSHWRRAPVQLATLLVGLALATALWSGVQAINAEARASYDAAAATLGEGRFDQITRPGGLTLEDYVALRRAGWLVSPVIEGRVNGVRVVGLDPLTAPGGLGPVEMGEEDLPAFLSGAGVVYGRAEALAALGPISAALSPAPEVAPNTVLTDLRVAAALLGSETLSRLIVAPDQPLGRADLPAGLELRQAQGEADLAPLTDSFHLNLTAFGLLSFAVGIFIVQGAVRLAFEQRRPVVRTLRALGVPLGRLMALMAAELVVLALLSGALGLTLGLLIAGVLLPDVAATLRGLYGADVAGSLTLRPAWAAQALGMTLAGVALAGAGALLGVARMPILAAARPRAWAMGATKARRWQGLAGAGLLGLSALLAWTGGGLAAGFACLGALLIGGALLLPPILARVLAQGQAMARGPLAEWFWADTRQQLPGLSLALMALLLAVAANVGVATMVSSFRLTFTGFLDQRLAAELYVESEAPGFEAEAGPLVDSILPLASVETTLAGLPGTLQMARPDPTYPENWTLLAAADDPWGALARGEGILVNEQAARRAGLALGEALDVGRALPIVGIYSDYGNPAAEAIVTEALFRELHPAVVPSRFGLRVEPARAAAVQAELEAMGHAVTDQAAVKRFSLDVFERTFAVTGALNVLTLAVAAVAMLMSLLTLATMRLPQLAPVWAMGVTRGRLGRLDLLRGVLLAALTAVLALPLGLALAWVLLAVVNVEAFGWRLPMFLFPADYARLGLLALLAGGLAALWPALRLMRRPPVALLKVFAGER